MSHPVPHPEGRTRSYWPSKRQQWQGDLVPKGWGSPREATPQGPTIWQCLRERAHLHCLTCWGQADVLGGRQSPEWPGPMPYVALKVITSILHYTQKEIGSQCNFCSSRVIWTKSAFFALLHLDLFEVSSWSSRAVPCQAHCSNPNKKWLGMSDCEQCLPT